MDKKKVFKTTKKILIDFIIVVLCVIAILAIWGFIQLNVQNKEYVNMFGYSILSTQTGSMSPTMETGDIIIIKISNDIKENDIITYKQNDVLITHRVIQIDGDTIITKGDFNNTQDEPIQKSQVIGKTIFIFNHIEVWKKVFTDLNVIIPLVITVILFIVMISYKEKIGEKNVG